MSSVSGITGSSTTNTVSNATTSASSTSSTDSTKSLASEQTFLKLFVAQLQNQDPLNPNQQDPTQMVSELAQFSELEQMVNIDSDVHSISQTIAGTASPSNTGSSNQSTGSTSAV